MNMTRVAKIIMIVFLGAIVGLFLELAPEASVTVILGFFIVALGGFLQADIKKMIAATQLLPAGEFEKIKTWKYALASTIFAYLTVRAVMLGYWTAASAAGGGLFIVVGSILSGLNQNSQATGKKS